MAVNIVVPEMGESIVDARIARWLKREGDAVAAGEALVELETDKVDVEVSAPKSGVLERISHNAGADVKIGEVLGSIAEGAAPAVKAAPAAAAAETKTNAADVAATPSARKAAREQNVELGSIKSEGPRVTKADVEKTASPAAAKPAPAPPAASSKPAQAPAPAQPSGPAPQAPAPAAAKPSVPAPARPAGERTESRERMSRRRATIAKRLVEAQQTAAMLTTFNEVDMSAIMSLRERQKEAFKTKYGVGLGLSSFFVKAAVAALTEFPRLNAEIQGDEIVLKHYFDIGIAVGAPKGWSCPFCAMPIGCRLQASSRRCATSPRVPRTGR
jgi:2-oxoglutarate dehydrogenase E2 component (dihydrolipoamide succinyltransferase)